MGIIMTCLFSPPKDVIDPVIAENKVVIIAQAGDEEKIETLKSTLKEHDMPEAEVTVHILPENCHKGRMKAHVEEISGGEELPFVTFNGVPLGPYSLIMAMAESAELYKSLHGKDKDEGTAPADKKAGNGNVQKERRPSMMDKFFGGGEEKKKKRRNTNTGSIQGSETGLKEETPSEVAAEVVKE